MTILNTSALAPKALVLRPGPVWTSFDKFKTEGVGALDKITGGAVATISSKDGQFRILREEDFQSLLGLASEVRRLSDGMQAILATITLVRKHPDHESVEALRQVVVAFGMPPLFSAQEAVTGLSIQAAAQDNDTLDDDAILDPKELQKRQRELLERL
jgi:hypothetical protein